MNSHAWKRIAAYFAAMYASEGWYEDWQQRRRINSKARGIVAYDRTLTRFDKEYE